MSESGVQGVRHCLGGVLFAASVLFQLGCDNAPTEGVRLDTARAKLALPAATASSAALGLASKKLGVSAQNVTLSGDKPCLWC